MWMDPPDTLRCHGAFAAAVRSGWLASGCLDLVEGHASIPCAVTCRPRDPLQEGVACFQPRQLRGGGNAPGRPQVRQRFGPRRTRIRDCATVPAPAYRQTPTTRCASCQSSHSPTVIEVTRMMPTPGRRQASLAAQTPALAARRSSDWAGQECLLGLRPWRCHASATIYPLGARDGRWVKAGPRLVPRHPCLRAGRCWTPRLGDARNATATTIARPQKNDLGQGYEQGLAVHQF